MTKRHEPHRLSTNQYRENGKASYDDRLVRVIERIVNHWLRYLPERFWIPFRRDMDRLKRILISLGTIDGLTGLRNRRTGRLQLASKFATARVPGIGFLYLDIEGFKKINDAYGHAMGDNVLQSLGSLVRSVVREQDLAFRDGGEEIAIALLSNTSQTKFLVAAQRIWRKIHDPQLQKDYGYKLEEPLGVSMGCVWIEWLPTFDRRLLGSKLADAVMQAADRLMYRGKTRWKDDRVRIMYFESHRPEATGGTSSFLSTEYLFDSF